MIPMSQVNKANSCKVIGITGGSGSGKTTLARKLFIYFGAKSCALIGQDYYYDQSAEEDITRVNFDHPSAIDFKLLAKHIRDLKAGKEIQVPVYDFVTHSRAKQVELLNPHPLIIIDGTLILSQKIIVEELDLAIFLDVPEDLRFARRLKRDVIERGRTEVGVKNQFYQQVKPMHDEYVQPYKDMADIIATKNYSEGDILQQVVDYLRLDKNMINMTGQI